MSHELTPRALFLTKKDNFSYDVLVEIPRQGIFLSYFVGSALTAPLFVGIVAFWDLNELEGTRADQFSNDLTDNNAVLFAPGPTGPAAKFVAAQSQYLSAIDSAELSMGDIDFTIAVWVYLEELDTEYRIFQKYSSIGDQRAYLLRFDGAGTQEFEFFISGDGTAGDLTSINASTFGTPVAKTWNLVVMWHDATANTISIQVNNGSIDSTAHTTGCFDNTTAFEIGRSGGLGLYLDGRVAKLGIWKSVLTTQGKTDFWNEGLGLSLVYTHQKQLIANIETILPPGGGLGAINSTALAMAVNDSRPSPQASYDITNPIHGSTIKVKFKFTGEGYADAIQIFSGSVDQFSWVGMDATFTGVDNSLLEDHILPHGLIDQVTYPNAPESSIGERIPILYGDSLGHETTIIPAILIDDTTQQWVVSAHANAYLSQVILLWQVEQDGFAPLNDAAFTQINSSLNTFTMSDELKGKIFGRARARHVVQTSLNAVNTANAIDGDDTTDTELQTESASGLGSITIRGTFPSTEDLTTNLVAYWPFSETSGTRNDTVGSNHLAVNNGPIARGPAISGYGVDFDNASSHYLGIADNADLSTGDIDFMWTGWIYPRSTLTFNGIFGKRDNAGEFEYQLYLDSSNALQWNVSSNGTTFSSENSISALALNTWNFFVVWHDATANILGVQMDNGAENTIAYSAGGRDGTGSFQVGTLHPTPTSWFDGHIANLRFYKTILTTPQRTQLWNTGLGLDSDEVVFNNPVNNVVKTAITQEYDGAAAATLENRSFLQSIEVPGATASMFNNLVYVWELNEASGNRIDLIEGKSLTDGSSVGSTTGKLGDAADFVAASIDYLTLADEANIRGGKSLTWTLWVLADAITTQGLFEKAVTVAEDDDEDYRLLIEDFGSGNVWFSWYVSTDGTTFGNGVLDNTFAVTTATWYFVRVWIDEDAGEIGIQIDDNAAVTAALGATSYAGSGGLDVGRYQEGNYFDGRIDNLMLHHRVWTSAEHVANYNADAGLAYPFGETVRRTIFDTQNHLAIENQAWELPIQADETRLGFDLVAQAFFPGGTGASTDDVLVAEMEIEAGFRPDGNTIPLFAQRVQGRADDASGTVTGTANALIQNPADVCRSIILNDMDGQSVETDLFDQARTDLSGSIFFGGVGAGYPDSEIRVRELLKSLAQQARSYIFQLGTGEWAMKAFSANRPTTGHFSPANMLWAWTSGSDVGIPANRRWATEVLPIPVDTIANRFEIRYCWHAGRKAYGRIQFANSSTDSHSTEDLAALCATSVSRYGEQPPYQFNATHICDDDTAEAFLSHVVNYFSAYRMHVRFLTTFNALPLTPGDVISIKHPTLPAILNGWRFEILRMQFNFARGEIAIEAREMPAGTTITVGTEAVGVDSVSVTT